MKKVAFAPLTDADHDWLRDRCDAARGFVDRFSSADREQPITLESLDRAFKAALAEFDESGSPEGTEVCDIVGAAFGQALRKGAGFEWVNASDDYGSGLAVRALPDRGDVVVYPMDFVMTRWERSESDFLVDAFLEIREQVEVVKTKWSAN